MSPVDRRSSAPRARLSLAGLLFLGACSAGGAGPESRGSPQPVEDSTGPSLLARGKERWGAGDVAGALEAFSAVVALDAAAAATRVEALRWIAHAHMTRSEPEAAREAFQAARALDDRDAWLCYGEGGAWSLMGELERAEQCYGEAIERDPGHVKAWQWRGETRLLRHDETGALADLSRALELVDRAADADLAVWGGDRRQLVSMTLALRVEALDALGRSDDADRDRARRAALYVGE